MKVIPNLDLSRSHYSRLPGVTVSGPGRGAWAVKPVAGRGREKEKSPGMKKRPGFNNPDTVVIQRNVPGNVIHLFLFV